MGLPPRFHLDRNQDKTTIDAKNRRENPPTTNTKKRGDGIRENQSSFLRFLPRRSEHIHLPAFSEFFESNEYSSQ